MLNLPDNVDIDTESILLDFEKYNLSAVLSLLFLFAWVTTAVAQYDDLYYDPDADREEYLEMSRYYFTP